MKFLIVDDSGLSRRVLKNCLIGRGHSVVEAINGEQALERFALEKPDFVFLDLVMPGLQGFEVLALLRALDPLVRIIICSSDIQIITRKKAREHGAVAFLNKPLNDAQVIAMLNTILAGQDAWSF